jgi:hypothetical protein
MRRLSSDDASAPSSGRNEGYGVGGTRATPSGDSAASLSLAAASAASSAVPNAPRPCRTPLRATKAHNHHPAGKACLLVRNHAEPTPACRIAVLALELLGDAETLRRIEEVLERPAR